MKSVCLICYKPNDIWFDFLSTFTEYHVYVIIDDNSKVYSSKWNNINIIQIPNEDCESNGFIETCTITIPKKVTGWSKALYYFSSKDYDHTWFFEDDVFFNSEKTLLNIDTKYPNSDLLSSPYSANTPGTWHWDRITIKFPPPYYSAMICAVRMSNKLVSKIKDYSTEHSTLFFTEALFPSLCMKHNLEYSTPKELETIVYRTVHTNIDQNKLFHPVKDISKHSYYRK